MSLFDRRPRHIRILEATKRDVEKLIRKLSELEDREDGEGKLKLGQARTALEHALLELNRIETGTAKLRPVEVKENYFECPECGADVPEHANICPECSAMFEEEE